MGAISVTGLFTVYAVGVEIAIGNFDDIARRFVGGMLVGTIVKDPRLRLRIVSAAGVGLVVAFRDRRKGGISWRTSLVAASHSGC